MTDRERLINLLTRCPFIAAQIGCQKDEGSAFIADFLLSAGVIVPPLKVEPTVSVYTNFFHDHVDVVKKTVYEWREATYCTSDEEAARIERELLPSAKEVEATLFLSKSFHIKHPLGHQPTKSVDSDPPNVGSSVQKPKESDRAERFFSPEDVRKMSPAEVRENYNAIMQSMKKW